MAFECKRLPYILYCLYTLYTVLTRLKLIIIVPFCLKGLKVLLDNRLSHPLLKTLFVHLQDFVHDSSEKVRIAFLDVLIFVKGLKAIKVG